MRKAPRPPVEESLHMVTQLLLGRMRTSSKDYYGVRGEGVRRSIIVTLMPGNRVIHNYVISY